MIPLSRHKVLLTESKTRTWPRAVHPSALRTPMSTQSYWHITSKRLCTEHDGTLAHSSSQYKVLTKCGDSRGRGKMKASRGFNQQQQQQKHHHPRTHPHHHQQRRRRHRLILARPLTASKQNRLNCIQGTRSKPLVWILLTGAAHAIVSQLLEPTGTGREYRSLHLSHTCFICSNHSQHWGSASGSFGLFLQAGCSMCCRQLGMHERS